jgi:O-antigen/teichoic acid export membrane protein
MIYKRRFIGYTGMAVKNSIFNFLTAATSKVGSLIFTIIIARLLLPELFGLYSLALSTIILFAGLSDFGIIQATIRYVSKFLGKNDSKKAKAYFVYLIKIKLLLVFVSASVLLLLAKFLATNYYNKPIFLALIAGAFYVVFYGLLTSVEGLFFATNRFKYPFFKEIIFQILRLTIIPLIILLTINKLSGSSVLLLIIGALSLSYFIALIFIWILAQKRVAFMHSKAAKLTSQEKREIWKFVLPLSATVLSGLFFGYIDIIMLGRYVLPEFIGFYRAAFSLVGSLVPFIAFSNALFPIFSRLSGRKLESTFKQTRKVIILASALAFIGTLVFAGIVINIIFGAEYSQSINVLRILALLLLCLPLSMLYESYFISQGKTTIVAKLLIFSTVINIILNFVFISWLVHYSFFMAIIGAALATIISRVVHLFTLMFFIRK